MSPGNRAMSLRRRSWAILAVAATRRARSAGRRPRLARAGYYCVTGCTWSSQPGRVKVTVWAFRTLGGVTSRVE